MTTLLRSATLKLTLWYLLVIMVLSVTFSIIIFQVSSDELGRGLPPQGANGRTLVTNPEAFEALRQQRITEARDRLMLNLFFLNITTLVAGGVVSFGLARRTLQPIQEAMNEQGRFTSDASHELRTPLTAMHTEIEVALRKNNLKPARMRELLESNLEEVDKLRSLSDRLLLLTSQRTIDLTSVAIDDVASEAVTRIVTQAQAKRIVVDNQVGTDLVLAHKGMLTDALVILLDNAIKYSPAETSIEITSKRDGRAVLLHVTDHGYGIKASDVPRVFDRFYRADSSRSKESSEGHGLGLSIAQRIVQLHKGKISLQSVLGEGTTFTIRLAGSEPIDRA